MIKTIICEDEYWVRKGLIEQIPWEQYQLTLMGEFANSTQAIEFMKSNPIDLIITDMNMKQGDGLSLLDYIIENHTECEIVVISGYTDFTYTKKAIQASVCEYLLKPVETAEICKVMDKITARIHQKEKLLEHAEKTAPLWQEQLLNTLVLADENINHHPELADELSQMGVSLNNTCFTVQVFLLRKEFSDTALTDQELTRWFQHTEGLLNSENRIFFRTRRNKEHFILLWQRTGKTPASMADFILTYRKLSEQCPYLIKSGIGDSVPDYSQIPLSYAHAAVCLEYEQMNFGVSRPVAYEDIVRLNPVPDAPILLDETLLTGIIKSGASQEFQTFLSDIFSSCSRQAYYYLPACRDTASRLALSMERIAAQKSLAFPEFSGAIRSISGMISTGEIRDFLSICFQKITESRKDETHVSGRNVVEEIQEYVQANYSQEISLMALAQKYYLNHIYLSRLFKAETGENFSSYLTRIRMEKAKELILKDTFKIKEIAEMVGFNNPYYFTKTFKKYYEAAPALLEKIK